MNLKKILRTVISGDRRHMGKGRPKIGKIGMFQVVTTSGIKVKKYFYDEGNASRWATWNYKGRDGWTVSKIQ